MKHKQKEASTVELFMQQLVAKTEQAAIRWADKSVEGIQEPKVYETILDGRFWVMVRDYPKGEYGTVDQKPARYIQIVDRYSAVWHNYKCWYCGEERNGTIKNLLDTILASHYWRDLWEEGLDALKDIDL